MATTDSQAPADCAPPVDHVTYIISSSNMAAARISGRPYTSQAKARTACTRTTSPPRGRSARLAPMLLCHAAFYTTSPDDLRCSPSQRKQLPGGSSSSSSRRARPASAPTTATRTAAPNNTTAMSTTTTSLSGSTSLINSTMLSTTTRSKFTLSSAFSSLARSRYMEHPRLTPVRRPSSALQQSLSQRGDQGFQLALQTASSGSVVGGDDAEGEAGCMAAHKQQVMSRAKTAMKIAHGYSRANSRAGLGGSPDEKYMH